MFEPTALKVLGFLREHPQGADAPALEKKLGVNNRYLRKALEKLLQGHLVVEEGGCYKPVSGLDEFSQKYIKLYQKLNRDRECQLIVRGLLSGVARQGYLLRLESLLFLLEEEGFNREEIKEFLRTEMKKGYLTQVKVCFRGEGYLLTCPAFIPLSYVYYSHRDGFGDYTELRERWRRQGLVLREDEYLMAEYPQELAAPARQYLDEERQEIKERLRREALHHSVF